MKLIHKFFCWILPKIAIRHPTNHIHDNQEYPQTWWIVTKFCKGNPKRKRRIQRFCGILTGHEISKTEWGYGGGKFVDFNCRWCDKLIKVPLAESPAPETLGDIIDSIEGSL